jgi:pyridoxine kinase
MPAIKDHWEKENIKFDAIYTGYLGSKKQIEYVKDIMHSLGTENCVTLVDPVMGDNGKLYPGFDDEFVQSMKSLIFEADYILPNITEACLLTDTEYRETYDEAFVDEVVGRLKKAGAKNIILTGASFREDKTGVLVYDKNGRQYYEHKKIAKGCHGTGDIYASAFTGALVRGLEPMAAAKVAADYTVKCIENTIDDPTHWYGAKFETAIPDLIASLNSASSL